MAKIRQKNKILKQICIALNVSEAKDLDLWKIYKFNILFAEKKERFCIHLIHFKYNRRYRSNCIGQKTIFLGFCHIPLWKKIGQLQQN